MLILGISGKQGSGKTTAANYICEILESTELLDVKHFTYASGLYELSRLVHSSVVSMTGVTVPWKKDRLLLQSLGEYTRSLDPDIWSNHLVQKILQDKRPHRNRVVVISDLRYKNEFARLKSLEADNCKVVIVRLNCSDTIRSNRASAYASADHISEIDLDDAIFDLEIDTHKNSVRTTAYLILQCLRSKTRSKKH